MLLTQLLRKPSEKRSAGFRPYPSRSSCSSLSIELQHPPLTCLQPPTPASGLIWGLIDGFQEDGGNFQLCFAFLLFSPRQTSYYMPSHLSTLVLQFPRICAFSSLDSVHLIAVLATLRSPVNAIAFSLARCGHTSTSLAGPFFLLSVPLLPTESSIIFPVALPGLSYMTSTRTI